jgi:glycosyltransferase involved in cell wall biosynthesis
MADLVSIVVPTYNRAYCVGKTIDSALAQTHRNLEILVADDGSSDNTRDLIQQSYQHEPRVKYLFQANQGVSAARNLGLRHAQGDYIALLDSDDLWQPWKLALQLKCLQVLPEAGMIWSDMEAIAPDGKQVHPRFLHRMYHAYRWFSTEQLFRRRNPLREIMPEPGAGWEQGTLFLGDIFSPMVMGNLVHTSTVVLTRARFEKVREFNVELRISGEDYDFHLRTCREGPVAFIDVPSIQYQIGFADRLSQHTGQVAKNFLKTLQMTLAREKDHIELPTWMVRRVLAESHSWVGDELLNQGDKAAAAGYFWQSLQHQRWQPRVLLQWLRCHMPDSLERASLGIYRLLKPRRVGNV